MAKKTTRKKKAASVKKKTVRGGKPRKRAAGKKVKSGTRASRKKTAKKSARAKTPATRKKTAAKKGGTSRKKKTTARKTTARKKTATPRKKTSARKKAVTKKKTPVKKKTRAVKSRKGKKHLTRKELKAYRQLLLNIRDVVVDDISFLKGDNLNHSQRDSTGDLSGYSIHMADQGTDNFDREFALNMVSSEHDILYEIDEAIRRIDNGTFGICEETGKPIEKERLKVIPYTRYCVAAQSEIEKGKARYRPFGPTLNQGG